MANVSAIDVPSTNQSVKVGVLDETAASRICMGRCVAKCGISQRHKREVGRNTHKTKEKGARGKSKGNVKTILSQSSSQQAMGSVPPVFVPVIVASAVPSWLTKTHASSGANDRAPSATKT